MKNDYYIREVFRRFVISCIFAGIGTALGTFVDAIIVGNAVGSNALAVINLSMPVFMLFNTVGYTIGMGAGSLISRYIGMMDSAKAKSVFTAATILGLAVSAVFTVLGIIFRDNIISLLGVSTEIHAMAVDYIGTVLAAAPLFIMAPVVVLCVRNDADPMCAMFAVNIFAVVNLGLDLLFVCVFDMKILGAAIAIVAGQLAAIITAMTHFGRKHRAIGLCRPRSIVREDIKGMVAGGTGYGLTYFFQMLVILILNNILSANYGVSQVEVYSVLFSISMLAYVFFDGISMTVQPLVSTYYGERSPESIEKTVALSLKFIVISGAALAAVILAFAEPLTAMFGITNPETLALSARTLRIYTGSILFISFNYAAIVYLQAIGREKLSVVVSLLRGFVLLAPIGALFARLFGAPGIPLAFIAVEGAVTVIILAILFFKSKKEKSSMLLLRDLAVKLPTYEALIDSEFDNMGELVGGIEAFCEENEIDPGKGYFINLVIEELVVKIFDEGFGKNIDKRQKKNYISLRIVKNGEEINIHIRDDATGYNPFLDGDDANMGMMGIDIVKTKAKYFNYQRKLVFNNLYVIL